MKDEIKIILVIAGLFIVSFILNSFVVPLFFSFVVPFRLVIILFLSQHLLKDCQLSESKTMKLLFLGGALGTLISTSILAVMMFLAFQENPIIAALVILIIDLISLGIGVFIWTKIQNWFIKRERK